MQRTGGAAASKGTPVGFLEDFCLRCQKSRKTTRERIPAVEKIAAGLSR